MPTNKTITTLRKRDPYCWHCGTTDGLAPHHRRNRQMGGSKLLDGLDNLMMVCSVYNGLMESDAAVASAARDYGHKLNSWSDFATPVFDLTNQTWYRLDNKGNKEPVEAPNYLI
jgi:hypothetical protein